MTTRQVRIVQVALAIDALMLVFPPFHFKAANGVVLNLGYGFILDPPSLGGTRVGSIDIAVLITQWVGVAIVAGGLWWLERR